MRGSKILVESLKRAGVEVIFGVTGGASMPIFDELYDETSIRLVNTRHEQGASHAADGYARATGKVGVAMSTSGPGATNLVTGIATAHMDSVPLVVITGQVATHLMGNDAFQECDVIGITRPVCKHSYLIKSAEEAPQVIMEAFHIASTGRPGPVVVDVAKDAQLAEGNPDFPTALDIRGYKPRVQGHPRQIQKAAEMIMQAERPMFYAGGGVICSDASDELRQLVQKTGIPITVTLMGLGAYPETDPLAMKMPGMHGSVCANYAFMDSDLVVAIGARFDDRVTGRTDRFAPHAKIVHIDVDPSCIGKNVRVDVPIVGDAKHVLAEMVKHVRHADIDPWMRQVQLWKEKYPFSYTQRPGKIMPQAVIEEIYNASNGEALMVGDVGQHQMWCAQYFDYTKPRHWLNSGGLGTMGYALPAALGAQIGRPDQLVVAVAGDGGFIMTALELVTAVRLKLPLKVIIVNNMYLGMVRQWQELFFDKRYAATDYHDNPDFAKLAEAYGAKGVRVTEQDQLRPAIDEAFAYDDGPIVLDVLVDEEENVFPMVPAGKALNEMTLGGLA